MGFNSAFKGLIVLVLRRFGLQPNILERNPVVKRDPTLVTFLKARYFAELIQWKLLKSYQHFLHECYVLLRS